MTPIRKTILLDLAEHLDHFLWSYAGEFGGDPWPNMPTRDACLYELARRSLDILLDLLTETGRPRPQVVPPSPDQVRRSQVASNHRRRRNAEQRDAARNETERSRTDADWQTSQLQATRQTKPQFEPDSTWFIPVDSLPETVAMTQRRREGMP